MSTIEHPKKFALDRNHTHDACRATTGETALRFMRMSAPLLARVFFVTTLLLLLSVAGQATASGSPKIIAPQQKLVSRDTGGLGLSTVISGHVAISGNYAIIAARPSAFIFERDVKGKWAQKQQLSVLHNDKLAPDFGRRVGMSGNYAIVSASQLAGDGTVQGAAYIFERNANGRWKQKAKLQSGRAGGHFLGARSE
jgi:hypothetical protein